MKTQGEIEAAVSQGMSHFEQEYMGRGPKNVHSHLIGDLLVVRLKGVLTAAEQQLVKTLPPEKGRDLLKEVRTQLVETARPLLETMIAEATGINVISLHHDISTVTGEEVFLFTLRNAPVFRQPKINQVQRNSEAPPRGKRFSSLIPSLPFSKDAWIISSSSARVISVISSTNNRHIIRSIVHTRDSTTVRSTANRSSCLRVGHPKISNVPSRSAAC